jgi:hypothetical protein
VITESPVEGNFTILFKNNEFDYAELLGRVKVMKMGGCFIPVVILLQRFQMALI